MRILILVDCYLPSTKSGAKLVHDLAVEFVCQEHEVIVAAPDNSITTPTQITVEDGVTIFRVRTGKIKGAGKIVRAFNEMRLSSTVFRAGKNFFKSNQCDLIVLYAPTIFFASLVKKLKKLWKCKCYLIQRDIFPKWALDAGIIKKGPVYWFFRRKELQHYNAVDIIAVESYGYLDYFSSLGLDKKKQIEVLYNWVTLKEKNVPVSNDRKKLGLENKIVFFYGGNIGVAQDMDNILRLAQNMRDLPEVYFLLVGQGSEVSRLKAKISKEKMTNISIHSAVPQEKYLGMLSQFDVGLISLNKKLKSHNFPGKMLAYMYFSMPILASINYGNDLKQLIEESKSGLVSLNGEHDRFFAHAELLAKRSNIRLEMGNNARGLLEKTFNVTRAAAQILSHEELYADKLKNNR
ncbi:glycosyltransferase family 4 protein [Planctomycetota bacterium]